MKLLDKKSRLAATVPVLVMVLCLFAAQAVARISPEELERVEAAAAAGDGGALHAAAYQATGNAVGNGMAVQDVCSQIALVAASTASDSGHSIESAVRSAVNGVNAAANEAAKASATAETQVLELDTYDCAVNAIDSAAETMGLDEQTVAALRSAMTSFLPEPKMPEAPMLETPDIRDRSSGSPI